jgi:tetratricopeptide (TPR) repeat protein
MGIVATAAVWSQQENSDLRSGNKRYKAEKYTEAEVEYRKALEKNNKSFETNFNLGNALFRQEKYADALQYYDISNALSQGEKQKIAAGYHNSGNALLMDNKIQESIEAYKNALRNNPKDDETRYNLAYAQSMLKKQEQNQNKDQEQNKENKSEEKEENQEQQQEQQQNRKKQQEQPRMSKENAQQILEALMQDEKDAKDKAKKEIPAGSRRVEKDW